MRSPTLLDKLAVKAAKEAAKAMAQKSKKAGKKLKARKPTALELSIRPKAVVVAPEPEAPNPVVFQTNSRGRAIKQPQRYKS